MAKSEIVRSKLFFSILLIATPIFQEKRVLRSVMNKIDVCILSKEHTLH